MQTLRNASIRTIGPELIFGRLFDEIGFDAIPEQLFRDIVVARLVYPTSKRKTADYLYRYQGKVVSEDSIYLPVLKEIQKKYRFGKPVVVADAAMLSKKNLNALDRAKYPFIVASRIRNESDARQKEILERSAGLQDGRLIEIDYGSGRRLIVSYLEQRTRKDAYNRQRGLARLRNGIGSGKLTKEYLNNWRI